MGLGKEKMNMSEQFSLSPEMLVSRLGDALVEKGLITFSQLNGALQRQEELRAGGKFLRLGQVLIDLGLIDQRTLDSVIAEQILMLRAALEEANAQLESRVMERTAQLQDALKKLSELNQQKSNFVANISHELRTPLTHLKGYLELLLNGDLGKESDEQLRALQIMFKASERLTRLIEDLIMFSMADRGDVSIRSKAFNLATLCAASINRMMAKASDKKISLDIVCFANLIPVEGDEEKLGWVILQLLDNAIKFTPAKGRVLLEVVPESGLARVTVTDTGIGIPADRMHELFEPFHQLDGSSTRRYGGTGLGLALAQKILEAHGSLIHVTSAVDKGSKFEFLLKSAENPPQSSGD
jgi:two-component system phosphate regulon sensor histidine kinase PhoR